MRKYHIITSVKFLSVLGVVVFIPAYAHAGKSVSSPYVTKGEWQLEAKTEYAIDDDDDIDGGWDQSVKLGYGFTDYLFLGGEVKFEDEPGEEVVTSGIEFETKIQLAEKGEYFVDPGISFKYKFNTATGLDSFESKLRLAKTAGSFSHTANAKIEREVGGGSSDNEEYEIAWKTKYDYSENFDFGFEYYGGFGDMTEDYDDQKHRIGPVGYGDIGEVEYQIGVLAGISSASPDATLKLNLEYEF